MRLFWVVVDIFSIYAHFVALQHPISAKSLDFSFFDHIYKLHGPLESIVGDRDGLLPSEFCQALFKISCTRLCMSKTYHLQSDGWTDSVCLEQYLRSITSLSTKKNGLPGSLLRSGGGIIPQFWIRLLLRLYVV